MKLIALCWTLLLSTSVLAETPDATTTQDIFQDWTLRCAQQGDVRQCTVSQALRTQEGQTVALVNVNKQGDALVIEFALPLMTALEQPVSLSVDGENVAEYKYSACNQRACFVIRRDDKTLLDSFKAGSEAKMQFSLFAGQTVDMNMSLRGFSRAVVALQERIK